MAVRRSGWWTGLALRLWTLGVVFALRLKANRSLTLEVTAEDEQGFTTNREGDACDRGVECDGCAGLSARRCRSAGSVQRRCKRHDHADHIVYATKSVTNCNRRSAGRWAARLQLPGTCSLCGFAEPATVSAAGGTITISGMGFRTGNAVYGERSCRDGFQLDREYDCRDGAFASRARLQLLLWWQMSRWRIFLRAGRR